MHKICTFLFAILMVSLFFTGCKLDEYLGDSTSQIDPSRGTIKYRVSIKVTKIQLPNAGDTSGCYGELYMVDPDGDWPRDNYKQYLGYVDAAGPKIITSGFPSVYCVRDVYSDNGIYFKLMERDSSGDDVLWAGYVKVNGTTNGWVEGWSKKDAYSGFIELHDNVAIHHTMAASEYYKGTTYYDALYFQVKVEDISTPAPTPVPASTPVPTPTNHAHTWGSWYYQTGCVMCRQCSTCGAMECDSSGCRD